MSSEKEKEYHRAYNQIYYLAHKDAIQEATRKWRQDNLEKIREWDRNHMKELIEKNPESIKRIKRISNRKYRNDPGHKFKILIQIAAKKKINFSLTLEEYVKLLKNPCYYCEVSLENWSGGSLDRINNDKSIGYRVDNVLPCCGNCNILRGNRLTVEETKIVVKALLEYRASINLTKPN
jgi:hypothetical protein